MKERGKINQYTCRVCGGTITTIDIDDGVTPFALACRATPGCDGMMMSSVYLVSQDLMPTHEWYKPRKLPKGSLRDHVRMGGLLIRPVK